MRAGGRSKMSNLWVCCKKKNCFNFSIKVINLKNCLIWKLSCGQQKSKSLFRLSKCCQICHVVRKSEVTNPSKKILGIFFSVENLFGKNRSGLENSKKFQNREKIFCFCFSKFWKVFWFNASYNGISRLMKLCLFWDIREKRINEKWSQMNTN